MIDRIMMYIFGLLQKIFRIQIDDNKKKTLIQFIKFSFVGLSNFFVSYAIYSVCLLLGMKWIIGSVLGFLISVLNSFFWNEKFVFEKRQNEVRSKIRALFRTYISYAFSGLILSNIFLFLWNDIFALSPFFGPIVNLVITTPINFLLNKLWAYRIEK